MAYTQPLVKKERVVMPSPASDVDDVDLFRSIAASFKWVSFVFASRRTSRPEILTNELQEIAKKNRQSALTRVWQNHLRCLSCIRNFQVCEQGIDLWQRRTFISPT
jgi:hypothetical protein